MEKNILLQEFIDFAVEIYWLKQKYQRKGKVHGVEKEWRWHRIASHKLNKICSIIEREQRKNVPNHFILWAVEHLRLLYFIVVAIFFLSQT